MTNSIVRRRREISYNEIKGENFYGNGRKPINLFLFFFGGSISARLRVRTERFNGTRMSFSKEEQWTMSDKREQPIC